MLTQQAALFEDVTSFVSGNDTIALRTISGFSYRGNMSVMFRNVVVGGGLAGIVLANQSHAIRMDNVQVVNSSFGIAAVNYSHAISLRDVTIMDTCVGIYTDNSTRGVRVSGNSELFEVNVPFAIGGVNQDINAVIVDQGNADPNCPFANPDLLRYDPFANNNTGGYTHQQQRSIDSPPSHEEIRGADMLLSNGLAPQHYSLVEVVTAMRQAFERRFGDDRVQYYLVK